MPKVLLTEPIPRPLAQRIQPAFPTGVDFDVVPSLEEADFAAHAADADILLVVHRKIDASTLALAPRVRFVQQASVGYDNLDLAALASTGVLVAYTPGANAVGVAEHTILLMLALLKRLSDADQATRAGRWITNDLILAGIGDLAGATIGLVGFGSIGQAVAERLAGFGAEVLYTSRHPVDHSIEARLGVTYRPLPALLAASSIVSLHLPLTSESRGLIGEAQLAQMRPGALLINTSRGEIVDEEALLRSLTSGHLGGAGLDVLEHEENDHNPFANRADVIVTPHVAGASRASVQRIMQLAVANVVRFLAGEAPVDLVPGG
jgi:phosphoglycerate dehydrogenase-like enzyme